MTYCIANQPTPLLNQADFIEVFGKEKLPLDDKGLLRALEMIAFPGTVFEIIEKLPNFIWKVTTKEYPHGPQFIDSRFVCSTRTIPPDRTRIVPQKETILRKLEQSLGLPYLWGGNWGKGIPEIRKLYPCKVEKNFEQIHSLVGVDCSGLLYEATNGYSPRNTSELFHFGEPVSNLFDVKPLDILVWPGHVLIFFSSDLFIESLYGKGVVLTPISTRLPEISNKNYQIRRFL